MYLKKKWNSNLTKKAVCVQIFSSFGRLSFSSAGINWWQLMTDVMQKKLNGIFIHVLKMNCMPNFSSLGQLIFSRAENRCFQLLSAAESWWQMLWKKCQWNFYLCLEDDTSAKFQLSRLIFIFISCQQLSSSWGLLTADDSWYEKNLTGICICTLAL